MNFNPYTEDDENMTYETPAPNPTEQLWNSTSELHHRFGTYPPNAEAQLRCVAEEYLEFVRAVDKFKFQPMSELREENRFDVVNEAADVVVTIMGVLMDCGITLEDLNAAMVRVSSKNSAKTHETHAVNSAGKIARLVKAE